MTQYLQNAACGAALILAVALLRRVLRDRLIPEARLALWAVCLFRLLTPVAPESVLSLWGLFRPEQRPAPAPYVPELAPNPGGPAAAPQPQAISWEAALLAAWLIVGAIFAVRYALSWSRTRRAVACAAPLDRNDPRYAALPSFARLREGPMEGAPLTFGVVRPTVVLSPGLEGEELTCVLTHEGVHARRRDNLWHYAMALALAVHWWNPAVWLMSRLLRRDVELSCDRAAVKRLGVDRRAAYAQALVTLATQESGPDFCQTFGRKATEERIRSIMNFKKTSIIGVVFTLALVLAVTAAFASDPADQKTPPVYDAVHTGSTLASGVYQYAADDATLLWSFTGEGRTMTEFTVDLAALDASLAKDVACGWYTQAQADDIRARAEAFRDRAPGTPFGGWLIGPDGSIEDDPDPLTRPENNPRYVVEEESEVRDLGELLGEGHIVYDVNDYDVRLPEFDEDGNPVNVGTIGSHFYTYELVTPEGAATGGLVGAPAAPAPTPESTAAPTPEPTPVPAAQSVWPVNSKGQTYGNEVNGEYPDLVAIMASSATGGLSGYLRPHDIDHAGYPGTVNNPDEAMRYMAWIAAQPAVIDLPLYDCEGNVIGEYHHTNTYHQSAPAASAPVTAYPVCAVDGCALTGRHDHDGVTYCGGAGHHNGICDGSCVYCAQQSAASGSYSTSGHHSESQSSGHHGNGHH